MLHVSPVSGVVVLLGLAALAAALPSDDAERRMHPQGPYRGSSGNLRAGHDAGPVEEQVASFWHQKSMKQVEAQLARKHITNKAKNLILFLGDGMSIPTLAATRVYMGGENHELSFDRFPQVGLSKTYCVDSQVADSACSSTAYLCGVKANYGTMGLTAKVPRGNCDGQLDTTTHVDSILAWAQQAGKKTGVVTTTRVTHASPGGTYAHIANRDWESDKNVVEDKLDSTKCKDIAQQLIFDFPGKDINVVMGGGLREFKPSSVKIAVEDGKDVFGHRQDKQDLVETWKTLKGSKGKYVADRDSLLALDTSSTEYLFGLFGADHVSYNLDRNASVVPSLKEMTTTAINMLKKSSEGYYLFVEGGRIDHGHHDAIAHYALEEAKEFSEAIQAAVDITSDEDTLIVVTSDHAHTMSMAGYANRGNNIFQYAGESEEDNMPYTTLAYANGPGFKTQVEKHRPDPRKEDVKPENKGYLFPGSAPLGSETHGGDDVGIFARGPWAHLYGGVLEQTTIPHIMAYAAKIGPYAGAADATTKPAAAETTPAPATTPEGSGSSGLQGGVLALCVAVLAYLARV